MRQESSCIVCVFAQILSITKLDWLKNDTVPKNEEVITEGKLDV